MNNALREWNMKKILVIEDYEITQHVMKMMITDSGYQSDIAGTGKEAIDLFRKNTYDFIFVDIGLPDQDGFTVIEEMRKLDPQKAKVPLIILSAYSDPLYQNQAKSMQLAAYIVKPLMPQDFEKIVQKYLRVEEIQEIS